MPSTEAYPFRRIFVDHFTAGTSKIHWEMSRHFRDPAPHIFQLQAGRTGTSNAVDWVDVGLPVTNAVYAEDDQQRLFGKVLLTHYRIKLTTPSGVHISQPAGVEGALDERGWLMARETIRKERLRHTLVSRPGFLLKRMRYGVRCDVCLDTLTNECTDSKCPTCNGVGFKVGYHAPCPLYCDLNPELQDEQRSGTEPPGSSRYAEVKSRVLGFPALALEDVWVDGSSDQRWFVHAIQHTAEWRGVPLVMDVTLRLAPFSHIVYRIEVGGEPASRPGPELPGTGVGTITVDHDYGGPDALTYQSPAGDPIAGATILAIPAEDYDAGLRDATHACASTSTMANGRWSFAVLLNPGEYMLVFEKVGEFGPDIVRITVSSGSSSQSSSLSVSSEFSL